MRHQKAVEAIVCALRIIEKLQSEFGLWALYDKRDELELDHEKEISRLRDELRDLSTTIAVVRTAHRAQSEAKMSKTLLPVAHPGAELWPTARIRILKTNLRVESRVVPPEGDRAGGRSQATIGTKRHWRSTRRGRAVVWL